MKNLSPLSKREFLGLHHKAWEYGWTYGAGFDELYEDYLINWVYFVDYLDLLILNRINNSHQRQYPRSELETVTLSFDDGRSIEKKVPDLFSDFFTSGTRTINRPLIKLDVFIGEAPPHFSGKNWKENTARTYFYHPNFKGNSDWLNVPKRLYDIVKENKIDSLVELAKSGFILIDIFPFPIIQDPKIRCKITGKFSSFLEKHFSPKYKNIIDYIFNDPCDSIKIKGTIRHAIAMPIYTSLQITFGPNSRKIFNDLGIFQNSITSKNMDKVSTKSWSLKYRGKQDENITIFQLKQETEAKKEEENDRYKFLKNLISSRHGNPDFNCITDWLISYTPVIPIFIVKGGHLKERNYVNSKEKNE